ncbi:unnamed protein product [Lota lota]
MEQKNGIELYVASDRPGNMMPRQAEEVIQSLNVMILHRHLGYFGITEVSSKNVLHQTEPVWRRDGIYSILLFLTIFIIITWLMVLYRLKPPSLDLHLTPAAHRSKVMSLFLFLFSSVFFPNGSQTISKRPTNQELKPNSSPFRIKPASGLQERRGSNVSLVLDMSALSVAVETPKECMSQEYLQTASRPLTLQQLSEVINNTDRLHTEFAEIPMNFVNPKELDIPSHGTKNRYKTILPNPHSRVILRGLDDPLSCYINANFIRGYRGDEKAFIATQGPMMNTVNDFWLMAWQQEAPAIVMITKLKEKKEKCVLYWPERRGFYGIVEVMVDRVHQTNHFTSRSLTLKCGGHSRVLHHFWFTSWPDHKTPDSALPLLLLLGEVEEHRSGSSGTGPVIVHCSAGIGRTGCFIAMAIGCRQLRSEGVVDLLGIVCQLRSDRGGMIQTEEQYEFVHQALTLSPLF